MNIQIVFSAHAKAWRLNFEKGEYTIPDDSIQSDSVQTWFGKHFRSKEETWDFIKDFLDVELLSFI